MHIKYSSARARLAPFPEIHDTGKLLQRQCHIHQLDLPGINEIRRSNGEILEKLRMNSTKRKQHQSGLETVYIE